MTIKLTPASFLLGVRQSGLIDGVKLDAIVADLDRNGVDQHDAAALAHALVQRGALTDWQSEKLLQGRHKGFILGRYKLLGLLGAGEMSAVYLAEHMLLERRCAIKVLPGNRVKDTSYLGRFHREAKAVASLNHLNIVRAYDVDQQFDGGAEIHFLVMEFVEGRNLEKIVTAKGALKYVEAVDYIRQAADGLAHAHQAGLVHRDIKPENLLIDAQGTVKILDLGLARLFDQTDEESLTIKHDEKVLGTADYLAPEQAIDSHKVDARADIYSLGCTFYFALTGHPPFTEGTLVQRLFAHQTKSPRPVIEERADAPASLMSILDKMMAKKAADRYQSAAELAEVLTRWLVENGGQAWKIQHFSLVATIYGLDSLKPQMFDQIAAEGVNSPALVGTTSSFATTLPGGVTIRGADSGSNQPPIYSTSASAAVSGATAGTSEQPSTAVLQPASERTEAERKELERRRRAKQRAAQQAAGAGQPSSTGGSGAATQTRTQQKSRTAAMERKVPGSMEIVVDSMPKLRSWISDPLQQQTRWMVATVGVATLALVCLSAFLFWFYQSNFPGNKQSEAATPSSMVIDAYSSYRPA
ncbi:MAG: serine/threonine protein kinase [Planctomycetaceae bacterium]|nr:serine/threonine protein kinase [Planctomycetaceae bacterium]